MNLFLSHESALQFWRWWSVSNAVPLWEFHSGGSSAASSLPAGTMRTASMLNIPCCVKTQITETLDKDNGAIRAILTQAKIAVGQSGVLHVAIPKTPGKHNVANIAYHQIWQQLPKRAFLQIVPNLFVASPELTFVQLATSLSFGALLALGEEMCGGYPVVARFQPDAGWRFGPDGISGPQPSVQAIYVRHPLSSPARIAAFAGSCKGVMGATVARRASRMLNGMSASVRETEVAILGLSPRCVGGLGAAKADLNKAVRLSAAAAQVAQQKTATCDLLFRDSRIAVEYDGSHGHSSTEQRAQDARRRNALKMDGFDVRVLTDPQFQDPQEFQSVVREASAKAGKWVPVLTEEQLAKHRLLRRQLAEFHNEASASLWFQ